MQWGSSPLGPPHNMTHLQEYSVNLFNIGCYLAWLAIGTYSITWVLSCLEDNRNNNIPGPIMKLTMFCHELAGLCAATALGAGVLIRMASIPLSLIP